MSELRFGRLDDTGLVRSSRRIGGVRLKTEPEGESLRGGLVERPR
jgi:hypothetical protein